MYGSESGGKSVLSAYIGGQFQQRADSDQRTVVYVDMEQAFDKNYAETAGLDCNENFVLIQPLNGEEAFTMLDSLIKTGEIGFIVWDSTTTTPTAAAMEDEFGKASFGGAGKLFSEGLKKLNPYIARYGVSMNLLTQMRAKMGFKSYGPPDTPSGGGYSPKFYASWRARISKGEEILNGKEVIGNQIKIKNSKSKIGFPKREATLDLYYGSGFNSDTEYIDFLIALGIVKKAGSWFSQEEWKYRAQGTSSLLTFLQNRPDIFERVKAEVNGTFNTLSILDDPDAVSTDDDLPLEEDTSEEVSSEE